MARKYATDTDIEVINFCLNCDKKRCNGNCEELAKEKKRVEKTKKETRND